MFVASAACEALTLERADSEEQWIYDPVMYPNGTIDHVKNQDPSHVALNITLSSESCSFINFRSLQSVGYMAGDLVPNTLNTTRTVICNNSEPRFIVSLSSTNVTDTMRPLPADLIKYSGTICRPKYGIYQAAITVNVNNSVVAAPMVSIEPDAQPSMLPNVSATDLATALGSSLAAVYNDMDFPDYLLKVHARLTQEEILSNGTLLAESVQETFPKVAAQIVDMYLTISAQQRISGYAIEMENRLIVRSTGFVSLEVLFICMTACTIWVMRKRPGNAVSRDPGSVIGMATILARSPQLCKALQGTGSLSLHTLRERIHEKRFNTSIQGGFGISESYQNDPDPNSPTHLLPLGTPSRKIIWYRPFSVKSAGKVLAVMAPVVVLAALEAVLQMSQAHAGLADIPHNRYVHYSFTLLPTAILVGIGMMFAALDFSARIFHPFHLMRRGNAYWSAISSDLLGKVGLHCFWDALRQQNIALANASLCIILSPFLTIVASGLFFTVTMPQRYDIRLSQIDSVSEKPWYSYLNSDMSDNQEAFTIANLIFFDNSSEPLFTYNDLAFPRVEFLSPTNKTFSDHFGNSQVSARLPALRARTNCTFLPDDMILDTTYDKFTHQGSNLSVMFEAQAPEGCGWGQYSTSNNESVVFDITVLKDRFFGIWRTTLDGLVNRPWCPITWAIFGQAGDRQATSVTAMHCRPYMERVDTDVTFNAKDFSFDPTKPPVPDESTAVYIQNISWSQTETNIFVPSSEDADPSPLSITMGAAVVDGLFAAVLAGRDGVPGQDLLGLANRDRLRAAVQRVYGRTFAQIFNTHRETAPPDAPALPAALEVPYRVRLKQSAVSTRILEGLLGVIALSAVLTFATLDTRRVLPKNPCSIAAMASLLAGADMLQKDVIPEGTEYMSGREMKEKGVFEGYLFTMGWWSNGRFGIDIGKAEPEQPAEG